MAENEESEYVTVVWGEEKLSPVSYNSMTIGPFYYKTKVGPNETVEEALARGWFVLAKFAREAYALKRADFEDKL